MSKSANINMNANIKTHTQTHHCKRKNKEEKEARGVENARSNAAVCDLQRVNRYPLVTDNNTGG